MKEIFVHLRVHFEYPLVRFYQEPRTADFQDRFRRMTKPGVT